MHSLTLPRIACSIVDSLHAATSHSVDSQRRIGASVSAREAPTRIASWFVPLSVLGSRPASRAKARIFCHERVYDSGV